MRKQLILAPVLFVVSASTAAQQACSDLGYTDRVGFAGDTTGEIVNELSDKRIEAVAVDDGEEWNEDHCASGALYKVGAGTVEDPRAYRGSWATNGANNLVTYDYTVQGTFSYAWSLWKNGADDLCWGDVAGTPTHQAIATSPAPAAIPGPDAANCSAP